MKKIIVLDTNSLIESYEAVFNFDDNDVVIPFRVLEEIDEIKKRFDNSGFQSRQFSKLLESFRIKGNLIDGVSLGEGKGTISVRQNKEEKIKNDNDIIQCALELKNEGNDVCLISNDLNVRLKCDVYRIESKPLKLVGEISKIEEIYSGMTEIEIENETIEKLYLNKKTKIPKRILEKYSFFPNQYIVAKSDSGDGASVLCRYFQDFFHLLCVNEKTVVSGIKAKNKEQLFLFDSIFCDKIKLVSSIGIAGSGKTCGVLACCLELLDQNKYDKIFLTRSLKSLGFENDIGFIPGIKSEKLEPWTAPIKDNLLFLLKNNKKEVENLFENGIIEVEALSFLRGRSLPKVIAIIDEAQNLNANEIKAICTRIGQGSKIIFTGDLEQNDHQSNSLATSGLAYLIEKFKDQDLASHITMEKSYRSELADVAARIL